MRRRTWIKIAFVEGADTAYIGGYGARRLIVDAGGRPLWSRRREAWMTSKSVGGDVLAMAELGGYAVQFEVVERGL